jgi:hypothetical protein
VLTDAAQRGTLRGLAIAWHGFQNGV